MRRAILTLVVVGLASSPPAALAAAWTAATRIEPLTGTVESLTAVVRDQHSKVEIVETATHRALAVPSDVLFAFDSARVRPAGARAVERLAADLQGRAVTVVGHTDSRGPAAYNQRLAARRAAAVAAIVRRAGLTVTTRSAGERRPVASNRRVAGRRRNRRVELVVARSAR